jgi:superfamily II DNA or RNA helicase
MAPTPLTHAHTVAAHIAQHLLPRTHPAQLGDITLAPHQQDAVARLLTLLTQHAGALLADDVGLGKTFIALGVAHHYRTPLILAPASLRAHWRSALNRTRQRIPVHSLHQLSTTPPEPSLHPDLVIIDEAHHLRTPSTQRYHHTAQLCRGAHVLLLSATPIHNSADDLHHLFALFNTSLTPAAITPLIVRRTTTPPASTTLSARPRVHTAQPLERIEAAAHDHITHAITTLPLPLPPAITALIRLGILRHWASSAGALLHALTTLENRLLALDHAVATGAATDARSIARQLAGPDALQLALLDIPNAPTRTSPTREQLQHAQHAVHQLRRELTTIAASHDAARAQQLLTVRDHHAPAPIIAFSQFASTVRAIGRALRHTPGVAMLTGTRAVIASGPLPRTELLRLVAPRAQHAPVPPPHQRVSLLLTTDALSEGLDLTDAAAVVHLDLPWTDTRLAQRVGRIARLGSAHHTVTQYHCQSPLPASEIETQRRRLADKQRHAHHVLGPSTIRTLGPAISSVARHASHREQLRERVIDRARRWSAVDSVSTSGGVRAAVLSLSSAEFPCAVGVVRHQDDRVVACSVRPSRRVRVGASIALLDEVTERLDRSLRRGEADGAPAAAEGFARRAVEGMRRWSALRDARWTGWRSDVVAPRDHAVFRRAARTIDELIRRLPAEQRVLVRSDVHVARQAVAGLRGVGPLRSLVELLECSPAAGDVTALRAWLARCAALAQLSRGGGVASEPPQIAWLLMGLPSVVG